jgi:hypothetical protein
MTATSACFLLAVGDGPKTTALTTDLDSKNMGETA